MAFILSSCMFAAAVVVSLLGQGGGSLYTPIQVWLGIGFHQAAATSLLLIMAMSISSSVVFRKANRIDWPLVAAFESTSIPGGFAGGVVSEFLSGEALTVFFAIALATAAYFMIRQLPAPRPQPRPSDRWFVWKRRFDGRPYQVNMALGLAVSFLVGMSSGLLGVGGGIFKVPMMVLLLGVPVEVAIGSSAVMVGLTAAAGLAGHLVQGHLHWQLALLLAAAVVLGAQLGSRISVRMQGRHLERIFGWFLLGVAVLTALRAIPQA